MRHNRPSWRSLLAGTAVSILVTACGGGSGSDSTAPPPSPNSKLGISASPSPTAAVGQTYSLQPTVSNASGTVTYSASNLPSWLTINVSTGLVTGTPTASDVGVDTDITVTANAGGATASLSPFSITVSQTQAQTGNASINWTIPTENVDGTALTNLAGFKVLYGQSPGELNQEITISNPTVSDYTIENLPSGTWYFAIESFTSDGVYSAPTNACSTTI